MKFAELENSFYAVLFLIHEGNTVFFENEWPFILPKSQREFERAAFEKNTFAEFEKQYPNIDLNSYKYPDIDTRPDLMHNITSLFNSKEWNFIWLNAHQPKQ